MAIKDEVASEVKYASAFLVMIVGLIVITVLVLNISISANGWKASDVTTLIGSLTTLLGSVVGAFLGVQLGAAGKDKVEAARAKAEGDKNRAEEVAKKALAALPPDVAKRVLSD